MIKTILASVTWRDAAVFGAMAMAIAAFAAQNARAASPQDMLKKFQAEAQKAGDFPAGGFSAKRGKAFFLARHAGGKPATPSCTTCHTDSPLKAGKTRTGKVIQPMAISRTPDRYSDPEKVAKWFRRNCKSVLGRECTPREKGDFLAYMLSQ